jgi:hypothetical protein
MKAIAALLLFAFAISAQALDVTFAWDANPESDVVRYRLYLYDDATTAWIPVQDAADDPATPANDTPLTMRLPAFPDVESRVRLTAINSAGLESLPSNELVVKIPPSAPQGLRYTIQLTGEITLTPAP